MRAGGRFGIGTARLLVMVNSPGWYFAIEASCLSAAARRPTNSRTLIGLALVIFSASGRILYPGIDEAYMRA